MGFIVNFVFLSKQFMVQNIRNKLSQLILHQVDKVEYFCNAKNISPNQAVHEFRKAFKRLRALLRFYERIPGSEILLLSENIQAFGKQLSPLRESYLNSIIHEKELTGRKLIPVRKISQTGKRLLLKNKLLIEENFSEQGICKPIAFFFSGFDLKLLNAGSSKLSRIHIVQEINDNYRKAFDQFQDFQEKEVTAEEFHSLRKKLKRLYYQLEFVRLLHPRYFKLKCEQLNCITDQLGDDHDLHVFSKELHQNDYGFSDEELHVIKNYVEHLRELNQLKLFPRLRQFFSESPEDFNHRINHAFKID